MGKLLLTLLISSSISTYASDLANKQAQDHQQLYQQVLGPQGEVEKTYALGLITECAFNEKQSEMIEEMQIQERHCDGEMAYVQSVEGVTMAEIKDAMALGIERAIKEKGTSGLDFQSIYNEVNIRVISGEGHPIINKLK